MRYLLCTLTITACAGAPQADDDALARLIGPGPALAGFRVHTDALVPGVDTYAIANEVPPGERAYFFFGTSPQRPAAGCIGTACLPFTQPTFLGSAIATSDGVAVERIQLPAGAVAGDIYLAAIVIRGQQFSATAVQRYTIGAPPACRGKGMTWSHHRHDAALGADFVGCGGVCDAYQGDTPCTESRPILCTELLGLQNPGIAVDFYHGWVGGYIDETPAVSGCLARSIEEANAICEAELGAGYEMAEHHMAGGGWNWWAYGNVQSTSFWAWVDDQPDAACFPVP